MGPISWVYIDMGVLLLLLTLMNLHSFCCPFSSSYHVFPFSTFAVIRQQSRVRLCWRMTQGGEDGQKETVFVAFAGHTWCWWSRKRPISISCVIRQQSRVSPPQPQADRKGRPIGIKLRKEEVKRSKGKLASGDRILQRKDH